MNRETRKANLMKLQLPGTRNGPGAAIRYDDLQYNYMKKVITVVFEKKKRKNANKLCYIKQDFSQIKGISK